MDIDKLKEQFKKHRLSILGVALIGGLFAGFGISKSAQASEAPPSAPVAQEAVLVGETDHCEQLREVADKAEGFIENISAELKAISCKVWGPEGDATSEKATVSEGDKAAS